tara:strand:- start:313 stop:726 length:414 start_codon:yes stop_codon:yes gene_type:complete
MADNEYKLKDDLEGDGAQKKSSKKSPNKGSKKKLKNSRSVTMIFNGEFLTKDFVLNNLPFIFFLILLMILSVGKGYYSKKLKKDEDGAKEILHQLRADLVELNARFEEESLRYRLIDRVDSGLVETLNATKVIRVDK